MYALCPPTRVILASQLSPCQAPQSQLWRGCVVRLLNVHEIYILLSVCECDITSMRSRMRRIHRPPPPSLPPPLPPPLPPSPPPTPCHPAEHERILPARAAPYKLQDDARGLCWRIPLHHSTGYYQRVAHHGPYEALPSKLPCTLLPDCKALDSPSAQHVRQRRCSLITRR